MKTKPEKNEQSQPLVLISDDDENTRHTIGRILLREGFRVIEASNGKDAMNKLSAEVAVALIDLRMPLANGNECLLFTRKNFPDTEVIMISANGKPHDIVKVMRHGAFWFLEKPFEREELVALVGIAAELNRLKKSDKKLNNILSGNPVQSNLVSESKPMQDLLGRVERVADRQSAVLITGPSGTGKTTLARYIHKRSTRSAKPFISISCAAIPRELLEAELFGYERGAFTGANREHPGLFELAHGGTVFLDEIGELPLELQPKLLSFLQDHCVRRVGGSKNISCDVRIIAATNRNLNDMCKQKLFREDLYFRLNVLQFELPPLNQRKADIEPLANHCLKRIADARREKPHRLSPQALNELLVYSWPGNVRELENLIERATAFCETEIIEVNDLNLPGHTSLLQTGPASSVGLQTLNLEELEKAAMLQALEKCAGSKPLAAAELGISTKSIYNKLHKYGMT